MALTYGFYDSLNGDRKYNAKQWSSIFDGIVNDGVLASIGDCFLCTATGSNMIVTVGSGRAWFDHTWILNDDDPNNPVTFSWASGTEYAPEPVQTRIDAIVIQTDSSAAVRANTITRVKGTPADSNPQKPTMTHTTYVNQYPLAYVTVGPRVSVITQSVIENAVGTTDTPFVTGLLEVLDSDELLAQWATDYSEWKADNNADLATWRTNQQTAFTTWRTNQQTAFTTWKTTEQADFVAWFNALEDYLTPSAEATLTAAVVKLQGIRYITLTAAGWTEDEDGFFNQTVAITGMSVDDNPVLVSGLDLSTATIAQAKEYNKSFGYLIEGNGTTANNSVSFKVYRKPTVDLYVGLKGA